MRNIRAAGSYIGVVRISSAGPRGSGRRRPRLAGLLLAALVALMGVRSAAPAHGAVHRRSSKKVLMPGLVWRRVFIPQGGSPIGPNRINVLTISPGSNATLDTTLARGAVLPGWQRTSVMAAHEKAIAAVNGDFGLSPGRPAHLFSTDGTLIQTSILGGNNFAVSENKKRVHISSPRASITAQTPSGSFAVGQWNAGDPASDNIAGYSSAGVGVSPTPKDACSVRLIPSGGLYWAANKGGVSQDYTVDTVLCSTAAMPLNGGVVLAANRTDADASTISGLTQGESVTLTSKLGWNDVLDTIGGNPQLISNGKIVVSPCSNYLCELQPRTVVGVTSTGKVLLVTIDGRTPGYSVGMTLVQTAKYMRSLGAVDALNLDGGGSTTMVIKGRVVNRPSDGSERYVSSALVVLPRSDPKVPVGLSMLSAFVSQGLEYPATPADLARQAWSSALSDPGSTGGLLEYPPRARSSAGTRNRSAVRR